MLDIDKLVPVPVDLSKLRDIVKKKNVYNAKIKSIEDKTPDITSALTAVENKIHSICNLLEKTDYTQKLMKLKMKLLIP